MLIFCKAKQLLRQMSDPGVKAVQLARQKAVVGNGCRRPMG